MEIPLTRIQEAATEVGREIDARLLVLFGSATEPSDRTPEDLDIAILGKHELDVVDATNRLTRRLEIQQIDVVDLKRADPLLLMFVARDGVPLYEAQVGEFARFVSLAARRYADTRKFRETERREILDFLASHLR